MYRGVVTGVDSRGVYVQVPDFGPDPLGPLEWLGDVPRVGQRVVALDAGNDTTPDLIVIGETVAACVVVTPAGSASEDRVRIQSAVDRAASLGMTTVLRGDFLLDDAVIVPSGATIMGAGGASVTQTANLKRCFTISGASRVLIRGLRITGKSSDWQNNSGVYAAAGVQITGACSRVTVRDCEIIGCAGAGVTVSGEDVHVIDCTIVGPGPTYITSSTHNYGGGVVGTPGGRWSVRGCDISGFAQGVVTGEGLSDVSIIDNHIHDIPGQHGLYLETANRLIVQGNLIHDCNLLGMKVQIATNYPTDSANMVISGNVIESVGSHGILLTNTLGGGTTRTRRAIVSNNVVSDTADDGINVQDGINVLVSDNVISDCRAGVLVADSSQVTVSGNHVVGARRQGVTVSNASQVWVVRNRIHNPASDNEASYEFGISAFSSGGITDLVIAGNEVIDALGNMRYGLYVSGDTSTFEFYDNRSTGATDYGARFGTAGAVRRWDGNTFSGTLGAVLNWPTSGAGVSGGERFGDAAPASGSFQRGDLVWNRLPSPAGSVGWVCTTAGAASSTAWAASTAYLVNDVVYNGTRVYRCTVAGTSDASGGPTGTGSAIADGTVTWAHVATRAVFKTFGLIES